MPPPQGVPWERGITGWSLELEAMTVQLRSSDDQPDEKRSTAIQPGDEAFSVIEDEYELRCGTDVFAGMEGSFASIHIGRFTAIRNTRAPP